MRTWFPRLLLIAALAFVTPDLGASAETVGGFNFTVPSGWTACKIDIEGFNQFYCNANNAAIAIQSPATATDANTLAHQDMQDVEIVNEQDAVFAGKAGHVVIGRVKQGDKYILVAIAATVEAGGARVGLIAAPEVVEASVQAWSALIDQGNFGGAAPEANQTFTVTNVGEGGCAATATIDGQTVEVAAGASTTVKLTEGKHEFGWTDSTGAAHSATADVPPADTLGASCTAGGTAPPPQQQEIPAANNDDMAMFEGARAAVKFYRILGNLVLGQTLLDPQPKSDRPMLRVLAERPDDRLATMKDYTGYLEVLNAAVAKSAGDPTKTTELRRQALIIMAQAGQIGGVPQTCNSAASQVEMIDCVVDNYAKSAPADVVAEWGRTFARIGNAANPTDGVTELQKLAQ